MSESAAAINARQAAERAATAKKVNGDAASGQSVTGERKPAAKPTARRATSKTAKPAAKAQPAKATQPVKLAASKPAPSSKYADQRVVAETLIDTAAAMIKDWDSKQHGGISAEHAVLSHTYNPRAVWEVKLNGVVVGESAINALVALHHQVPVTLITGDQATIDESAPFLQLAQALRYDGSGDLADRAYAMAFEREPTNPQILMERAQTLQQAGKLMEARKVYRQIADGEWQPRFRWVQQQARWQMGVR